MKKVTYWAMIAAVFALGYGTVRAAEEKKPAAKAEAGKKSAAELEKEKALANPYPNDLGPGNIDALVKSYPDNARKGYELLKLRCAKCHTPSRPLNSRFVEPEGKDEAAKKAAVEKMKKEHPEMFGDKALGVWQIEESIWKRYVKRMAAKPGCDIVGPEAKTIWEFLVYDSKRKLGEGAAAWKEHREGLLKKFKEKYPKRYDELKEQKDL